MNPRTNDNNKVKLIKETCTFQLDIKEEHVTQLDNELSMEDKSNVQVIQAHADMFAWSTTDIPGIDPASHWHRLFICRDAKPIAQRKRKMGEEKCQAV